MTDDTIVAEALQKTDPEERAAFLDEACAGDPERRARVEERLRRHAQPATTPPGPGAGTPVAGVNGDGAKTEEVGRQVGPYKLLSKLGEGGMGAVWLADQEEPVQRRVAIKLIKAGMDSALVVARFEAERQALALMDHPNIAKVLDAGTTSSEPGGVSGEPGGVSPGRPYFVMELVKGIPITGFCDQRHLTLRERLELFLPVCRAVQHAHQKGIIHRDLKPSNILVALHDDKPVPKVIDFGVAKATGQRLTEHTLFTEVGSLMGTLEYMAPEQAEVNNLDIDTRADVYSLGVILYELLTGGPPFSGKHLRTVSYTEMLHILREVEPPRPSTRLRKDEGARMKDEKKTPARSASSAGLHLSSFQELDWIVMKCLEKERARRYETVNALAQDLERYLADEPVLAGPVSRAYRLRKFLRRHRGPVLAAGLLLLALVVGAIGTTVGLVEARRQWANAEAARVRAEEAGELARQNATATREVVEQFLVRLGDERLSALPGFEPVRKDMMDLAVQHYRELICQWPDDNALRSDAAQAFRRSANLCRTIGQATEARALYAEAVAAAQEAVRREPSSTTYGRRLAETLCDLGNHVLRTEGPKAAAVVFREALATGQQLQEAAGADTDLIVLVARTENDLGEALGQCGEYAEALEQARTAAQAFSRLADEPQSKPVHRLLAAFAWTTVAQVAREAGRQDDAARAVSEAVRRAEAVLQLDRSNPNLRYGLAGARLEAGRLWAGQAGQENESAVALDEAVALLERLTTESPQATSFSRKLAVALAVRGRWHLAHQRPAEAAADARRALEVLERLEQQTKKTMNLDAAFVAALTLAAKAALSQDRQAVRPLLDSARRRLDSAQAFNPEDRALRDDARALDEIGRKLGAGK
jgi:serine/threonine protein kinase